MLKLVSIVTGLHYHHPYDHVEESPFRLWYFNISQSEFGGAQKPDFLSLSLEPTEIC